MIKIVIKVNMNATATNKVESCRVTTPQIQRQMKVTVITLVTITLVVIIRQRQAMKYRKTDVK